ncbi:MAG: aminotransferase DegT [Coxiella sp. RIFCSPHIGHO2_12_FULL_44_14]|nr:MAG: aminotransferase DegT [Coxiella sp. RIFCSPHIGHO2_12_FULL_44_14]
MKFIDLHQQYQVIVESVNARMKAVLEHGQYIMGPEVAELEERLAHYVQVKHCITMSNGTAALQVALMALDIQPGDEIITTPFSFFATAETIVLSGAKPVFVDIHPRTYNIDHRLIERAITPRTRAIMPVNLYGQCADFDPIRVIANQYRLAIIEDAAQSFGATYQGLLSCSLGTISCTSFFPSKPFSCYGDGGACFTNDDALAHAMRSIRNHGQEGRYHHTRLGINARLDTLQAAVLLAKLEIFKEEVEHRQIIAQWYNENLDGHVIIPYIEPHNVSTYAQYTIQLDERDAVQTALQTKGIPTAIHYPKLLNQQPALHPAYSTTIYPVAELATERVLSLPFHPYLTKEVVIKLTGEVLGLLSRKYAVA